MIKIFTSVCLILSGLLLLSFAANSKKKKISDFTGFWINGNPSTHVSPSEMKVFEADGSYYNLSIANGESIMTHKGKFDIVDSKSYKEKVTNVRFNAAYDLKNKEFINKYEFSKDKKWLHLSGTVISKNGKDTLNWSENYRKVEVPE